MATDVNTGLQQLLLAACLSGAFVTAIWKSKRRLVGGYAHFHQYMCGGVHRVGNWL